MDTTGDGKADTLQVKGINVAIPYTVPSKIEYGDKKLEDVNFDDFNLSDYMKIYLDENELDISKMETGKEVVQERFIIYHKGDGFRLNDILNGTMAGRTIAMGDTFSILIKLEDEALKWFTEGKHSLIFEGANFPKITINFELTEKNMNVKFDPREA